MSRLFSGPRSKKPRSARLRCADLHSGGSRLPRVLAVGRGGCGLGRDVPPAGGRVLLSVHVSVGDGSLVA